MPTSIPTPIASELELLQNDIARKLNSEAFFCDIPIFAVRSKTIESVIANAVTGVTYKNGKTGIAVRVEMPSAGCNTEAEKAPGPFLTVSYIVRIQEIPQTNMGPRGTQKSAEDVALNVLNMLHLYNFGRSLADFRASPNALVPNTDNEPFLMYEVEFHAVYQLPDAATLRVPTPTASIDSATNILTLDCSDAAARMYWTANDANYPSAADGGTLYTAPFAVTPGQTVRVCAYKDGLQSSEILRLDITA